VDTIHSEDAVQPTGERARVRCWIERCLPGHRIDLLRCRDLSGGSGCDVWDCTISLEGHTQLAVLKIFKPGFEDTSGLGPVETARKCALLLSELPGLSVPVPGLMGFAVWGKMAAVLSQRTAAIEWRGDTRIEAAQILARFHGIALDDLSGELAALIARSSPNRGRVFRALMTARKRLDDHIVGWSSKYPELSTAMQELADSGEPFAKQSTLVHGDYFSANLLLGPDGLYVIDWELAALGDPMWDLAFLIGADRDVSREEVEAVLREYRKTSSVDAESLGWHRRCWDAYWRSRELTR